MNKTEKQNPACRAREQFNPGPLTRNPHIQTYVKSIKFLAKRNNPVIENARSMIIPGTDSVRLHGYYTPRPDRNAQGLLLLLHGWEGSSDSAYILHTGGYFYHRGYDVFRLNLRDHGDSHHLNEGLFHAGLIDEVLAAAQHIAALRPGTPLYVMGFSLGGNFALRLALRHTDAILGNLAHVFAISPALDPYKATVALDNGPLFYRHYFLRKWIRSLKKKEKAFPALYNFEATYGMKTVMDITDYIIGQYSPFRNHREYFSTYTLPAESFDNLSVPVTIITAEDDPVVPVEDFNALRENDKLRMLIQRYGGHCGFIDPFPFGSWYERTIISIIQDGNTSIKERYTARL
jgi:predicted alpha/beta-fold hydrolase